MPDKNLSSAGCTPEEKVKLLMQVLGLAKDNQALQGNAFHRLVDSGIQWIFRRIIPLNTQLAADEQWIQLLQGYLRFGRLSRRLGRIPFIGNRLIKLVSGLAGRMVMRNRFWMISASPIGLVGVANEYIKFAEGIGLEIDYNKSYAREDEVVLFILKCSAGVTSGYPQGTCRAMNEMDREIIRLLGGKLQTPQTIADNGRYCCFRITRQAADDVRQLISQAGMPIL